MPIRFTLLTDSSHGWLQVTKPVLLAHYPDEPITTYSFMDDKYVYLEEDYDAGLFLSKYHENTGIKPEIDYISAGNNSWIRTLSDYKPLKNINDRI